MNDETQSPLQQPYTVIEWFTHEIGWMVNRQRELAQAAESGDAKERIGELTQDVEAAWQETQRRWGEVKGTPVVMADVRELAMLVGGKNPRQPTYAPPTGRDADRCRELLGLLERHAGDVAATGDGKPSRRQTQRRPVKPDRPNAQAPAEATAMTPNEQALIDVLTDEGQTGPDLAAKLARQGFDKIGEPEISRMAKRPHMKARGVRHRNRAGYFLLKPPPI